MTFWSRLKFMFGILFVLIVVGLLVLYLNNAMSVVHSTKAQLSADTTAIGADYAGLIIKQNVSLGDKVSKNQTLFVVRSPQLLDDIANGTVRVASLPFSIDPKTRDILLKANDSGVVQAISYQAGSFVPTGAIVATLNTVGTLYVSAHYHLSPPDYARLKKGNQMDVTFPDNRKSQATVYDIALASSGGNVDTIIKARLQNADVGDFRFPVGTPVEASLKLTQRTWYQNVTEFARKLFKPTAQ